jgi:hypothetical protein
MQANLLASPCSPRKRNVVDLAALSLSGDLVPSVPCSLAIKFNPPLLALIYSFEHQKHKRYIHEIEIEPAMLCNHTTLDIVSYLYMS